MTMRVSMFRKKNQKRNPLSNKITAIDRIAVTVKYYPSLISCMSTRRFFNAVVFQSPADVSSCTGG